MTKKFLKSKFISSKEDSLNKSQNILKIFLNNYKDKIFI